MKYTKQQLVKMLNDGQPFPDIAPNIAKKLIPEIFFENYSSDELVKSLINSSDSFDRDLMLCICMSAHSSKSEDIRKLAYEKLKKFEDISSYIRDNSNSRNIEQLAEIEERWCYKHDILLGGLFLCLTLLALFLSLLIR